MPMIRAMRLLNALEAGTLSGPQLDALFQADPSRVGEFQVLLDMPGQLRRVLSSETTLAALAAADTVWSAYPIRTPQLFTRFADIPAVIGNAFGSALRTDVLLSDAFRPMVFASANGRAAMAASALAMANLTGSAVKLREVIASQAMLNEVFARPAALAALRASTALPVSAVPLMTGASTPAGNAVSASSTVSGGAAYSAFDKGLSSRWTSNNSVTTNQWLRHSTAGVNRFIHRVYLRTGPTAICNPKGIRIEYSLDASNWLTAATGEVSQDINTDVYFDVNCAVAALHWRLFMIEAWGTSNIYINELDFFGFEVP